MVDDQRIQRADTFDGRADKLSGSRRVGEVGFGVGQPFTFAAQHRHDPDAVRGQHPRVRDVVGRVGVREHARVLLAQPLAGDGETEPRRRLTPVPSAVRAMRAIMLPTRSPLTGDVER